MKRAAGKLAEIVAQGVVIGLAAFVGAAAVASYEPDHQQCVPLYDQTGLECCQ